MTLFHITIYDKIVRSNYERARAYNLAYGGKHADKKFPCEHYPIHPNDDMLSL
jgi:hypothetical protein